MNFGTRRTAAAREYIAQKWRELSDRELASDLNMSVDCVRHMRRRLGFVRDKVNIIAQLHKGFNKRGYEREKRMRFK